MSTTELYLDPQPLLDAVRNGRPWHTEPDCDRCTRWRPDTANLCITIGEAAAKLGVAARTIQGWRADTGRRVSAVNAERLAHACGFLDYEIWPELLDQTVASVTRVCAFEECSAEYVPARSDQRFCSPRCREAADYLRRHPPRPPVTCPGCGTTFTLTPAQRRRYCTPACQKEAAAERTRARDAEIKRIKYHTDPEFRVSKLAAAREYKTAMRAAAARRRNQAQEAA